MAAHGDTKRPGRSGGRASASPPPRPPRARRNERVAVTLSPEAKPLLQELSTLTGRPKAALVSELLDQTLPALRVTLEALRLIRKQPDHAVQLLTDYASSKLAQVQQATLDLSSSDRRTVQGKRQKRP